MGPARPLRVLVAGAALLLVAPSLATADLIYTGHDSGTAGTTVITYDSSRGTVDLAFAGTIDSSPPANGQSLVNVVDCTPEAHGRFSIDRPIPGENLPYFQLTVRMDPANPPFSTTPQLDGNLAIDSNVNPQESSQSVMPTGFDMAFDGDRYDKWPTCIADLSTGKRIAVKSNIPPSQPPRHFSGCSISSPVELRISGEPNPIGEWSNVPQTPVANLSIHGPNRIDGASRCRVANEAVELATPWARPNGDYGERPYGMVPQGTHVFRYGTQFTPQFASEKCKTVAAYWKTHYSLRQTSVCTVVSGGVTAMIRFQQFE
jgi:hypothetical protein